MLEVITGPMFSGKTEELIRLLRREEIAGNNPVVFKPAVDTRFGENEIASHSGSRARARPIGMPSQALKYGARVVAFDEAQFFDQSIEFVVQEFLDGGTKVYVAGLDKDFRGKPFGPMPYLLAMADTVLKLTAVCVVCQADATMTYRTAGGPDIVVVGGTDKYEARCRKCHRL